jgi:hypothetical protein
MRTKNIYKSKTFWTGIGAILTAAAGYFTGGIALAPAIQTAVTGLIGIFLRTGMMDE